MADLLNITQQLLIRLKGYPPYAVVIEISIITLVIWAIFKFLKGTRGARAIKGVILLTMITTVLVKFLGSTSAFARISFLYSNFLSFASLALVIVFQPELRRAFVRIGEARLFTRTSGLRKASVIESLVSSFTYLSQKKIGAIVAIEKTVGLKNLIDGGVRINASITPELLNTIFWPGSALHDMGVVIQGEKIVAAGVQFPLAEGDNYGSELGSRHRAAIGLSQEVDAIIIVVSEETGIISIAQRGQLIRNLSIDGLRSQLTRGLEKVSLDQPLEDQQVSLPLGEIETSHHQD